MTDWRHHWYFYQFNDGKQRAIPVSAIVAHATQAHIANGSSFYAAAKLANVDINTRCKVFNYAESAIKYLDIEQHEVIIRADLPVVRSISQSTWKRPTLVSIEHLPMTFEEVEI